MHIQWRNHKYETIDEAIDVRWWENLLEKCRKFISV